MVYQLKHPPRKAGRPLELTEAIIDKLVALVPNNHNLLQVCRMAMLPQPTVFTWYNNGKRDIENNVDSLCAQFTIKFDQAIAIETNSILSSIKDLKTFSAYTWILEKCYADEYGPESPQVKQIHRYHEEMMRLKDKEKPDGQEITD